MENFATADVLKGFKLAKISVYFSNDDLGSVFLTRLTETGPFLL